MHSTNRRTRTMSAAGAFASLISRPNLPTIHGAPCSAIYTIRVYYEYLGNTHEAE